MNKLLAGIIIGGFSMSAQAALVYMEPLAAKPSYEIGETVALDLKIDFTGNPSIGGGVDVFFDTAGLAFQSWTAAALGDTNFRRAPDVQAGELNGIAFGDFAGLPQTAKVGTLEFKLLQTGSWLIDLEANDAPAGPFYSSTTFNQIAVTFNDTTINAASIVPVPGAFWLFGSALLGLAGFKRQRKV
jgi:hypothetical protein